MEIGNPGSQAGQAGIERGLRDIIKNMDKEVRRLFLGKENLFRKATDIEKLQASQPDQPLYNWSPFRTGEDYLIGQEPEDQLYRWQVRIDNAVQDHWSLSRLKRKTGTSGTSSQQV